MTEEIVDEDTGEVSFKDKKTNKPYSPLASKKKRKAGTCDCPNGPKPEPFTNMPGMTGEFCGVCMEVLHWAKEGEVNPEKVVKPKAEKKPKLEKLPIAGSSEFPVIKVLAINDKPDHMEFVCSNGEKMFSVTVPSTKVKVDAAMANPGLIVGKLAVISHEGMDEKTGFPVNPKVTEVKSKPA